MTPEVHISAHIHGNLTKLKPSQTKALQRILKRRVGSQAAVTQELATELTLLSEELRRIVAVLINRRGHITDVMLGETDRVYLPDVGRQRAGETRFRGVRLLRTNLRGDRREVELTREDLSDLTQLQLDMVISVAVTPGGYPGAVAWAHLSPKDQDASQGGLWQAHHAQSVGALDEQFQFDDFIAELEAEYQRKSTGLIQTEGTPALLAFVQTPNSRTAALELAEMQELCRTAQVDVRDTLVQKRTELHPKYAIGKGRLEDLAQRGVELGVDLVIFAQELRPGQLRAITDVTNLRIVDRTQLILDIFAQHASTRDGKLQVELAQLRYNLPRLSDRSTGMSRLTGGIGGRGPGETKLEINRRRARDRIQRLDKELSQIAQNRQLRRSQRQRNELPTSQHRRLHKRRKIHAPKHPDALRCA